MGRCQALFRSCKSGVQLWLLKFFWLSRNCVFCDTLVFSINLDIKKLTELEFLNLTVGCCQSTARGYKSGVQVWLLKFFWFSRIGVFYDYFFFFQKKFRYKKIRYKKLTELEFLNLVVGCCQGTFRGCKSGVQVWLLKSFNFSRYGVFIFFFSFFFSKNLDIKKLTELEFLNLIVGCCQGTARGYKSGVPVWLLKSFWFSRNCVFYDFFHFFDQKTDIKKPKFKFSTLSWGAARVHSVVANLES